MSLKALQRDQENFQSELLPIEKDPRFMQLLKEYKCINFIH